MAILEKIAEVEAEMKRTQKNATEYHLGLLKAKLARYRAQLLEPAKKGPAGEGFEVQKFGSARISLLGFPSTGKSTLLSKCTKTESMTAAYEYTTLTAIPGVLELKGAKVQLLDLPGIIEGAAQGRGRGRQVVSVMKTSDLIVMMLDCTKATDQRRLLEVELEAVGVRINQKKPDIQFKRKTGGGVTITATVPLTKCDERTMRSILQQYKLHNMDVMIREDITVDQFLDVLLGNRKYIPCLYVYNKIDAASIELVNKLAREDNTCVISALQNLNIDEQEGLLDRMWEELDMIRVYTKRRGQKPDFSDPLVLQTGSTVEDAARLVHKSLVSHFKYALVWGKSSKFNPMPFKASLAHRLVDGDVISIAVK